VKINEQELRRIIREEFAAALGSLTAETASYHDGYLTTTYYLVVRLAGAVKWVIQLGDESYSNDERHALWSMQVDRSVANKADLWK
jgi:hypothetical protein